MDTLVIDIETKNTFHEVGRDNFDKLDISFIGIYSYEKNEYFSFFEHQIDEAGEMLRSASLLVGFSINRFDIPVLKRYFAVPEVSSDKSFDIYTISRYDILDEIEMQLGRRISLNVLAKANLGVEKTHHSLEAPILYNEGRLEELKDYCLNDVKITKELYDLTRSKGRLLVPQKEGEEIDEARFNLNTLFT